MTTKPFSINADHDYTMKTLKGAPVFGHFFDMTKNLFNFINDHSTDADIVKVKTLNRYVYILFNSDLIEAVYEKHHSKFDKSDTFKRFEVVGGQGLITCKNGEKWKKDRKAIQPAFNKQRIKNYHFRTIKTVVQRTLDNWEKRAASGPFQIDLAREMSSITTDVVLRSIFGTEIEKEKLDRIADLYESMMDYIRPPRLIENIDFRKTLLHKKYLSLRKDLTEIKEIIDEYYEEYNNKKSQRADCMLSYFSFQRDDRHDPMPIGDFHDHIITLIFAGYETTANAMYWLGYELSDRPDVQAKICHEVSEARKKYKGSTGDAFSYEDYTQMNYIGAVFKEVLRAHPSIWATSRVSLVDWEIGDNLIPKNSTVILPQYTMHRHPKYWEQPDLFYPERFLDNTQQPPKGTYFPFSFGPRGCIGYSFADIEARVIIAELFSRFRIKVLNKEGNGLRAAIFINTEKPLIAEISKIEQTKRRSSQGSRKPSTSDRISGKTYQVAQMS